jgi:hypothetical protein
MTAQRETDDGVPSKTLIVKGLLPYRLGCAVSFLAAGLTLLVGGLDAIEAGGRPFLGLAELALSSVSFSLSVRSLTSRVVVTDDDVALHSVWRTVRVATGRVTGVARGHFLGWEVLTLTLVDGSSIRLPLLTQPGDPTRLRTLEESLNRALPGH